MAPTAATLGAPAATCLSARLDTDFVIISHDTVIAFDDLLDYGCGDELPMRIITCRNDITDIDVNVVVSVYMDTARRLQFLELFLTIFLKFLSVGVAVIVKFRDFVKPKQTLRMTDIAVFVGVEMHDCAILELASAGAHEVVGASVDTRHCEIE